MNVEEVRSWFADKFEQTAYWRKEKANQYPSDNRNKEAVKLLLALQAQAKDIDAKAAEAYSIICQNDEISYQATEIESEGLRAIGFSSEPESATVFVENITRQVMEYIDDTK